MRWLKPVPDLNREDVWRDNTMNYKKLRYFYTVAQTLNFTKAAEQLYISQSAVSRHMKELEEDFGVPLFVRTNRDLILTDAGRVLKDEVQQWFSREDEIYQKVRAAAFKNITRFNIGFMGIRPAYHIPAIVNQMLLESPDLSVNLRRYNWDEILASLNCNETDICLRLRMGEFQDENYEHFVLDQAYPAMVVSARHPMAKEKKASLKAFRNERFLILSGKDSAIPYSYTRKMFQKSGFIPQSSEYDQVETILMMIHSDAGVSLLSRFAATDQFPDLCIVELEEIDPLYLELIWKKNNANAFIPNFVEKLNAYYTNLPAQ